MEGTMSYTADFVYNNLAFSGAVGKLLRQLDAETDTAAIAEAERLLRSCRVVAGVEGAEPPAAGVVAKDGQEFVCCIVNQPTDKAFSVAADTLRSMR
jgi:hypothetical protein